jgi:hypothetical protein
LLIARGCGILSIDVDRIQIEGLNGYERGTLEEAFATAGLGTDVVFQQPSRVLDRPGALDTWIALVEVAQPTLMVLAAWMLKTRRKVFTIVYPDETRVEIRQESIAGRGEAAVLKELQRPAP